MTSKERHFFYLRKHSPEHDARIPDLRNTIDRQYDELMRNVFDSQVAIFDDDCDPDSLNSLLSQYFYKTCYDQPTLHIGTTTIGAPVTIDDFIQEAILSHNEGHRNRLCYLLGDVGVGKTALINYLFSVKFKQHITEGKIWFLRFSLEAEGRGCLLTEEQLFDKLLQKVSYIITKNPSVFIPNPKLEASMAHVTKVVNGIFNENMSETERQFDKKVAFKNLVLNIFKESKRRLIFVIDNIDYLCHYYDRKLFLKNEETGEDHILLTICKFMDIFLHRGFLGDIGANMIFVTRDDSYKILTTPSNTSLPPFAESENISAYTVPTPPWESVLASRKKLLDFIIPRIQPAGKQSYFKNLTDTIAKHMACAPSRRSKKLSDHLIKITNYGFREMMQFFSQYAWVGEKEQDGRFIHQYPVGLMTFMLNRFCRYSQISSNFPNIYLVVCQQKTEYDTMHEHPHTYWLKRLLMHLISTGTRYRTSDLVSMFEQNGYDEFTIRECLGSLTEANASNMIRVLRERSLDEKEKLRISNIDATIRGQHSMKEIVDRFFYLQLIVDDFMLPVPKVLTDEFRYSNNLHYGYVVASLDEYWEKAETMINIKAKQVLLFLEVLDSSLEIETLKYSQVFERLGSEGVIIPHVSEIKKNIIDELETLSKAHNNFINVDVLKQHSEGYRKRIDEDLLRAYACS